MRAAYIDFLDNLGWVENPRLSALNCISKTGWETLSMPQLKRLMERLQKFFSKDHFDGEMDEELRFHLESMMRENMKAGMSQAQARQEALIAFGGFDKTKEECRDTRWTRIPREIWQDLLYGLRMMRKSPGLMTIAIIILALGIGANTAIVSFIDAVIFRPPSIPAPERVLSGPTPWSLPDYRDVRLDNQVFSCLAAYIGMIIDARDSNSELLSTKGISSNYFQAIGLPMAAGRGFLTEEEDFSGGHRVAIISHRYWQRAFQGDPAAIGKNFQLNGEILTVVGVAPQHFQNPFGGVNQDVWVPFPMFFKIMHVDINKLEVNQGQTRTINSRDLRALVVFGRIKQGVSSAEALARINVLMGDLRKTYPKTNRDWQPLMVPLNSARWPGKESLFSYAILMGAGICILLITCMNVANLLLARGSARTREIAVRFSLGASRFRVIRQLLTEGLVLSTAAVLAGLAVCGFAMKLFPLIAARLGMSSGLDLVVDQRNLIFAVCIGALTNILFGLAPALVISRSDISSLTKYQEFFGLTRTGSRWRHALVVLQMALSVILLIAAGLFVKTVLRFQAMDIGYNREVMILSPDILSLQYDPQMLRPEVVLAFYRRSLDQIRGLPGVRSASLAEDLPLDRVQMWEEIRRDPANTGNDQWPFIHCNSVSSGYFRTIKIPILQGRDFTDQDSEGTPGVVIVNETMARQFWPGAAPLGKRIRQKALNRIYEVIGVVKDVKYDALSEKPLPYAYFHYAQAMLTFHMDLHVQASGDPRALIGPIRKAIQTVDARVAVDNPRLMSEHLDSFVWQERAAVYVFGFFGPLSLILASIGLYGLVSYSVARRAHEFGIRVALGARRNHIQKLVLREGMISILLGLAIGLPFSIASARLIASRFQQVSPFDPTTYIVISLLCIAVSAAATLWPARRAHLNPWDSLRNE
jgi:macrolide transport system ATP-binding/permease protein